MKTRRLLIAVALLVALASSAPAQGLLPARPEAAGMSGERLARLTAVMRDYVDRGRIGGTVSLVARDGKIVYLEAAGWQDRENKVAMRPDTIFRAASMSKAATSIAIVMLMEEGKLMLGDPVSRYIPSFKETTVAVPPPPGTPGTGRFGVVPARREITLRDLLTHTAGISYGQAPSLAAERYKAAGVQGWYFADKK